MPLSLSELNLKLSDRLKNLGYTPEQVSAEVGYIFSICELDRGQLYKAPETLLSARQEETVQTLLHQRFTERIPVQYLAGKAVFYGLELTVSPAVLIPRPETELLVETALIYCQNAGELSILDLGTGSGAIPIALASRLEQATRITAVDISPDALKIATANAQRHGVQDRIDFRLGNLFEPLAGMTFDVILSNPPYIDPVIWETLAPEVRDHEPALALKADEEGYAFYRRIAAEASNYLHPGGSVLLETGSGMTPRIGEIFQQAGYRNITVLPDYAGIDRVIIARLQEAS